jgi:hypothetical protein
MAPEFFSRSVRNPDVVVFLRQRIEAAQSVASFVVHQCPTRVTGGEYDTVTTINDAEDITAAIPRSLSALSVFLVLGTVFIGISRKRLSKCCENPLRPDVETSL